MAIMAMPIGDKANAIPALAAVKKDLPKAVTPLAALLATFPMAALAEKLLIAAAALVALLITEAIALPTAALMACIRLLAAVEAPEKALLMFLPMSAQVRPRSSAALRLTVSNTPPAAVPAELKAPSPCVATLPMPL
jgi:hypothetical protein